VDYQLSASNTLSMRYSYLANDRLLTGIGQYDVPSLSIGNVTVPSAGDTSSSSEHLFQIVDTPS
jgi:hypothetical protein